MPIDVRFFVATVPKPSNKRHAALVGGHARVVQHQSAIAAIAAQHRPAGVIDSPVVVDLVVVLPRPLALCKLAARTGAPLKAPGRRWAGSRPDIDNLAKSVLDGLRGWWCDDSLVVGLRAFKVIGALGEAPGYHVRIRDAAAWAELVQVCDDGNRRTAPLQVARQQSLEVSDAR